MDRRKVLALLGYGRLGRFLAPLLQKDFDLRIYDADPEAQATAGESYRRVTLAEATAAEILLLAVPMCAMEEVCRELAPMLRPGQLVLDTCSVKMHPMQVMRQSFPAGVEIIGTHPLFGPDSGRDGLAGLKIVLCPLSDRHVEAVRGYLQGLGLRVLQASPEEHDRAMAETQCLFHLMARAIQEMDIHLSEIATPGPEKLFRDFAILQKDTRQLFIDLQTLNPFAEKRRKEFIRVLEKMDADLPPLQSGSLP